MIQFVIRFLLRTPGRTATRIAVVAASSALLGAMVLFVGHSLRTMTGAAVRSVPLDWQGPVASEQAASRIAAAVAKQPDMKAAVPAATAPFAGAVHTSPQGRIQAGGGELLAVPPDYVRNFHTLRLLRGGLHPGAVVLDQQLAATLQAQVGDTVSFTIRKGAPPVKLPVSGIAVVTAGDVLFQPLNPLLGPTPAQPPADVAILPLETFVKSVVPQLGTVTPGSAAAAAVSGAQQGVTWQVQAQVDPAAFTGSPLAAYNHANQIRNHVESTLTGKVQFVDNLSDHLSTAAGDALYAEALFVMLAVPGALVGLGLAYLAALGAVERDRRMLFLLRARGATPRRLFGLAAVESVVVGVVAGGLGAAGALIAERALVGGSLSSWPWAVLVCVLVAGLGSLAARTASGLGAFREGTRPGRPLWQRLYLDFIALGVSGLVYWLTARTGFSAVINPDSNPTLSLSIYMFFAPALLWIGATLLLVRLRGRVFALLAPARARSETGFLLASAARRGPAINRVLVVVALLLGFAVNLAVFSATWDQQARVDAELTLGSDIVVTGATGLEQKIASVPGVAGTTAVDHTYAYVGPDLQDTFGIDPATFLSGTTLRDSYFIGGTAREMLARLQARPDAILVSKETVTDYSLGRGDLLRLRTLDHRTGKFHVVPFHVVGIVQEFPSAPRDSFMVVNRSYILRATHDPGPNVIFAKANGDPAAVAQRVAAVTKSSGALVKDIRQQAVQTVSAITTVDLRGISRIEGFFALLLAAAAMALSVALAIAERRQEFATMAALGASARRVSAFVWSEVVLIVAAASVLAAGLGLLLAKMLVAMLQHAFDPPPDHLAIPWGYLLALALAIGLGAAGASLLAARAIRRLRLGAILREE